MLIKQIKLHHSVTELGNLQLRQVTNIIKDNKIIDIKYSDPYIPRDVNNMADFDQKSKDIVSAIIDNKVKEDFEKEKQIMIGEGLEEIITYDRVIEEDGKIAIRRIIKIFDDGKQISKKYHRSWLMPGDNSDSADIISKTIAKKLHTIEVINNYKANLAEQNENII